MQKAVISPLKVVISKSIMTHLKAVISTPEGGDQHSEGSDKQKKTSLLGLLSEPKHLNASNKDSNTNINI